MLKTIFDNDKALIVGVYYIRHEIFEVYLIEDLKTKASEIFTCSVRTTQFRDSRTVSLGNQALKVIVFFQLGFYMIVCEHAFQFVF